MSLTRVPRNLVERGWMSRAAGTCLTWTTMLAASWNAGVQAQQVALPGSSGALPQTAVMSPMVGQPTYPMTDGVVQTMLPLGQVYSGQMSPAQMNPGQMQPGQPYGGQVAGGAVWTDAQGRVISPALPQQAGFQLPIQAAHPGQFAAQQMAQPVGGVRQVSAVVQQVQDTDSARAVHHLIQSMPTSEEELEVIDRRSQLIVTRENLLRIAVADPAIIDFVQFSPREISVLGLQRGSTTLTLWFENVPEPLIYLVKVIRDPNLDLQRRLDYGKLEKKLMTLFPNSKVYLIALSNKIIVRGQARDAEEAAHILNIVRGEVINQEGGLFGPQPGANGVGALTSGGYASVDPGAFGSGYGGGAGWRFGVGDLAAGYIVNELRVPGEFQVLLKVQIAELSRSQARRMGVDLEVAFNSARSVLTSTMAGGVGNLGGTFENGDISVLLDWLASNGVATIHSRPNMSVLSGHSARFLAGGEFAVPTVVGIGGAAGQTTTFRGFGTSVVATPTVLDRDLIRLTTVAEYSDINNDNAVNGIPGTNTRRVETTVQLREGQTLALAGLLAHRKTTEVSRIPVLGDIPKVGPALFSRKRSSQDENELLVIVTPELVSPMNADEVPPMPGHDVTMPGDCEFYWHNQLEGTPDTGVYQLPPYGSGSVGTNVGYQNFNPGPAGSMYSPIPTNGNGQQFSPTPLQGGAVPPVGTRLQPVPDAPPYRGAQLAPGTSDAMGRGGPRGGWSTPAQSPQTIMPTNHVVTGNSSAVPAAGKWSRPTANRGRY